MWIRTSFVVLGLVACSSSVPPLQTASPGVVFTYPIDHQIDVPLGTRVVVTFSDPVVKSAIGACTATTGAACLVGPNGPIATLAEATPDGFGVQFLAPALEPGTTYGVFVRAELSPTAKNLQTSGPLFSFTTRANRPRGSAPTLVAVNGGDPAKPDGFRPMLDTSTIRLVFSEPLDQRTVQAGSIELVDAGGTAVPATIVAQDIHVSIDPVADLTPGMTYTVRLGGIADLEGRPLAPTSISLTPEDTKGKGTIPQVLRTRSKGDPGPERSRSGAEPNVIQIDKPLIGTEASPVLPSTLATELGDPKVLDGPIAFTIRRGQRVRATSLDVKLGGEIPVGLTTGDILIEFLTDGGGRLYRNPYQPAAQRPENDRSPLFVDLSFDVAIYAVDPMGNAVLAQSILGVQATGTAVATDGVLAIETVGSMEFNLLGVTQAPTNLVLELITDPKASVTADTQAPKMVSTSPPEGSIDHSPGDGVEIIFDEPVDLDRLRAGGLRLEDTGGNPIAHVIESHGSAIVVRPIAPLAYSTSYRVVFNDVADLAGNQSVPNTLGFSTPLFQGTSVPLTVVASHPGAPCALSNGHCAGGGGGDDVYKPFSLAANEPLEVVFSQPPSPGSVTHGTTCGTGSVQIEEINGSGACVAPVAGMFKRRDRSIVFVPETPWVMGTHYRLTLISGSSTGCNAGELCGPGGNAANFDPLSGTTSGDAGGTNMVIDFVGDAPSSSTFLFAGAGPYSDINSSGFLDNGELTRDENRASLHITGTTGAVSSASFNMLDCAGVNSGDGCMYLSGSMPVQLGELSTNCPLPDGTSAPSCVPVTLFAQAMYATSLALDANVVFTISSDTGTSVLRIREPAGGPVTGYIVSDGASPKMVVALDLYMDAPDLSLPLGAGHDLHSKPLSISLSGPVTFLPDGRISISLKNVADVPVTVNIDAPLGVSGAVQMVLPANEMKLQLISRPLRGTEQ